MPTLALRIGTVSLFVLGCGRITGIDDYEASEKQCTNDDDCAARGLEFAGTVCRALQCVDPVWGCLDAPPSSPTRREPFKIAVFVQGVPDFNPIDNAEVTLCRGLDTNCTDPLATVMTNEEGDAVLEILPTHIPRNATGLGGFLMVTKRNAEEPMNEGFLTSHYHLNPAANVDLSVVVQLLTVAAVGNLTQLVGTEQRADRGAILLNALTCESNPAASIVFELDNLDSLITRFYVVGTLPTSLAESTGPNGFGGFTNVPPGVPISITGRMLESGRPIDMVTLATKANTVSQVRLMPGSKPIAP